MIKSSPLFLRGRVKDVESWAGKVITSGVISEQTVSKPWQSSIWLVDNRNKGPTRFYKCIILIYLTQLFLLRNEIIVAIRTKICTSPSSTVAPRSLLGYYNNFYVFLSLGFIYFLFLTCWIYTPLLVTALLCLVTPWTKEDGHKAWHLASG